jgi:hypothetical protein
MASMEHKKCVVCGLGSSRADWASRDNPSCDGHTAEEVRAALAKLAPAKSSPAPPAPKPANGGK